MKLTLFQLGQLAPLGIPVPGYLIQTADGVNALVDSGFPRSFIEHPPGPQGPLKLQPLIRPQDHVTERLASVGLQPSDIDLLICTHFDADHAGNHDLFASAELIVQRSHYDVAKAGDPRFAVIREHWDAPQLTYRLVDGDTAVLPGVDLIESSGHVTGHQSVLVRLPGTGPVLLAIDAIPAASAMDPATRPIYPNDEDEAATRQSTQKLVDLIQAEGVALTIHGHDPEQWQVLRQAPQSYC